MYLLLLLLLLFISTPLPPKCSCGHPAAPFDPLPPSPPHLTLLTRTLSLVWKARSPRRQTVALTHYTVKSSITRFFYFCGFFFFFSSTHLCVFKFDRYKHCSKCYEKKCTLGFLCVFLYKAGRSGLLRLPAFVPSPPLLPPPPPPFSLTSCFHPQLFLPPSRSHLLTPPRSGRPDERLVRPKQTGFKIDLYIFIYAYIKKGGGGGRREEEGGQTGGVKKSNTPNVTLRFREGMCESRNHLEKRRNLHHPDTSLASTRRRRRWWRRKSKSIRGAGGARRSRSKRNVLATEFPTSTQAAEMREEEEGGAEGRRREEEQGGAGGGGRRFSKS